jgi:hypothetical protein
LVTSPPGPVTQAMLGTARTIWPSLYSLSANAWRASESSRLSSAISDFSLRADEVAPRQVAATPLRLFAIADLRRRGLADPALERGLTALPDASGKLTLARSTQRWK